MVVHDDDLTRFESDGALPLPPGREDGWVENDGARIWYSSHGEGKPVVLLHGGLGNAGNWGYQVPSLVESGRRVVRLKGGDPMLFARAQEELNALAAAGIECEVVPGVTAALAAAASVQVSLTRRGVARTVAFLTPRVGRDEAASAWLPAAMGTDTVVLYMAAGASQSIAVQLVAAGKPAGLPAVLVESATLPGERRIFTTLRELAKDALPPAGGPVVMALGEVFRDRAAVEDIALEQCQRAS